MSRLAKISRLTLGAAQLGMPYGIVNTAGDLGMAGASALLDAAWNAGITCFDTARNYGESEIRIGAWLAKQDGASPVLISKIPPLDGADDAEAINRSFAQSGAALGVERIEGLLCHRATDLSRPAVRTALERLVANSKIERFGVSAYSEEQLFSAIEIDTVGIVQVPLSLANPMMFHSGAIGAAAARGVLVFARSVYLQGVLLAPAESLPVPLAPLAAPIRKLHALAREARIEVSALALAAVNAVPGIHSIVVGAESGAQIAGTMSAFNTVPSPGLIEAAWLLFKDAPPKLVNPLHWPAP